MEQVRINIKQIRQSSFPSQFTSKFLSLNHILHVSSITKNLLSVTKFAKVNVVYFELFLDFYYVKDQVHKEIIMARRFKNTLCV